MEPHQHTTISMRHIFVSKIFLIVNITTIFMNLSRQMAAADAANIQQARPPAPAAPPVVATGAGQHHLPVAQRNSQHDEHSPATRMANIVHLGQLGAATDHYRSNSEQDTSSLNETQAKQLVSNLDTSALIYLQKYGYMSAPANGAETNNLVSEDSFSSAIAEFQRFAGIPQTGIVDNQTIQFMKMPRCGNLDKGQPAPVSNNNLAIDRHQRPTIDKSGQLRSRANLINSVKRKKRYALQGSKWRRQELTYRISQYPTRFNGKRHEVDSQIEKAFGIWSQVAPIDFVPKKDGRVHIDIRFASGDHGDGDAFDGPGNTLAHAYFPQYGGDAHFDDQEYWTIDSYAGTNIFQVAAHELGHSLGLGHSNVREALMAPFYQKYKPNFRLHMDDVLAIQALYGEKPILPEVPLITAPPSTTTSTTTTTTTTSAPITSTTSRSPTSRYPIYKGAKTTTTPASDPLEPMAGGKRPLDGREMDENENNIPDLTRNGINGFGDDQPADGPNLFGSSSAGRPGTSYSADLCSDASIDAVTRTEDGSSYVFKGDFYWMLTQDGLAKGYPRRISTDWDGLPGHLDAALTWADGKTFFFKGNKYWRFRNKRRDVGYPKLISAGFAGIPDDIDAAFVWSGNGRTYIFKGDEYWRFDSKADPPVSSEYPRPIKVWSGVPAHVNAAFKWENNVTYFFKGNHYYRFNDREFKVEPRGRPPFPRQTSEWWFGCVNSNLAQRALMSSLRDSRANEGPNVQQGDLGDWSLLAGLEENIRLMGTHISDHKPPQPSHVANDANEGLSQPRNSAGTPSPSWLSGVAPISKRSSGAGFRLGIFDHPFASPTSSSSSSSFFFSSSSSSSSSAIFASAQNLEHLGLMLIGPIVSLSLLSSFYNHRAG